MAKLTTETHRLLTKNIIALLNNKNVFTTIDFVENEVKQTAAITGLSSKEICNIKNHVINKHSAVVYNGLDYYLELLSNQTLVPTGIKKIDDLLNGGLCTGNIYEVCGKPGSGKTQFCLSLVKNIAQNLQLCVVYIDTKRDFSVKKIKSMLGKQNEKQLGNILNRIIVYKVNSKYELLNVLYEIKSNIAKGWLKTRLIIIDSLPSILPPSSSYAENNCFINQMVNIIHFLAVEYYLTFIIVNIVTSWYDGDFREFQLANERAGCGKYWHNIPNVRMKFEQIVKEPNKFTVQVEKGTKLEQTINCVTIDNFGLT